MFDDPRLTPEVAFRIFASRRRLFHENPTVHARVFGSDDAFRPPPCGPPRVLGVLPGPRSVTVLFEPVAQKVADGGPTSHVLRINHACSRVIEMEVENVRDSAYTVTGLPTGRQFTATVASRNLVGVGDFSPPSDPFLPLPAPKTPPSRGNQPSGKKKGVNNESLLPGPPGLVLVAPGVRGATVYVLMTTAARAMGATGYVLRIRDGSGRDAEIENITGPGCVVDKLCPGVVYTVSLAFRTPTGVGQFSDPSDPFTPLSESDANLVPRPNSALSKLRKACAERESREQQRRPKSVMGPSPPPAILGVSAGPRRAIVRFSFSAETPAGASSSFVLRLHNLASGHVREINGVTRSPHTLHGLCNGEAYTVSVAVFRGSGRGKDFSEPSDPFVPAARS